MFSQPGYIVKLPTATNTTQNFGSSHRMTAASTKIICYKNNVFLTTFP